MMMSKVCSPCLFHFHMQCLFVSFLFLFSFPSSTFSLCNLHDSSALLLFKNSFALNTSSSLHSPCSSKTESWKNGTDCCEWDGVTCDTISGHVIGLDLSCSYLQGQFHPNSTIFKLRHLQQLNLAYNDFSGSSLYSGIGDLVNLMHLNLSNTGMSGDIPSTISHLSKLVSLDLDNILVTIIDPTYVRMRVDSYTWENMIENATNLRELSLDGVDMSSIGESSLSLLVNLSSSLISLSLEDTKLQGNLSSHILYLSLFNLTQLSSLDLSHNKLVGPIPSEINQLPKLQLLVLSGNMLNGTIPRWCYSSPSLLYLILNHNYLTGSLGEFSTYSLEYLDLSGNKLQGNFPNSIFELENLTSLDLSSNVLSGLVNIYQSSKLKNLVSLNLSHNNFLSFNFDASVELKSLYFLDLSHNNFLSFNFDASVELKKLYILHLSHNNISGFPKFLAQLQNLESLDLSYNKIRGSIPKWFREKLLHSWKNISNIDLSFNKLQGDLPIPPSGIQYFSVSNNELTGDIPSTMCNASFLAILNLAHNNLTGQIPQCLATFASLSVLDLQMNNFYGNMPQNFSKENAFETIKLNGNRLEGPLPQSLAHCARLQVLDLGNNNIEDTFPHWLETLPELRVLSLRSNRIHGIVTCFGTKHPFPSLRIFDVSNNNFSGPLPASYIKNFQGMMSVNESQTGAKYMRNDSLYSDSVVVVMKGQLLELMRIFFAFTTIDLSNNMFEGELPKVIGELHSLIGLNLSHNAITGTIPQSMAYL